MIVYRAITVKNPRYSNCGGSQQYDVISTGYGLYNVLNIGLTIDLRDIDFIEAI